MRDLVGLGRDEHLDAQLNRFLPFSLSRRLTEDRRNRLSLLLEMVTSALTSNFAILVREHTVNWRSSDNTSRLARPWNEVIKRPDTLECR